MNKTTKIYLLIISLISINAYSQVNKDSLLTVWNNTTLPDSTRLSALDIVTWHGYLFSRPDSGYYYAQIQYDYAKKVGNKKQMGNALNTQGVSYSMRGDYAKAIETLEQTLKIRKEINDSYGIAKAYMNMGPPLSNQGNDVEALDVYEKSLEISEPNNYQRLEAVCINNIGVIYESQNNKDKALEYYRKSLNLALKIKNKRLEANTISNISIVYKKLNKLDSALVYAFRGLNAFEEINDIKGVATAYENIGRLYKTKNENIKAIDYELKAIKIREEIGDKLGLATNMIHLGLYHLEQGDAKASEVWCKKGLNIATSIGSLNLKKSATSCLYKGYAKRKMWKKAFGYQSKFSAYGDSISANNAGVRLVELEFTKQTLIDSLARETRKIESFKARETKINRRNSLQYMGISIVLLLLIGWMFFASRLQLPKWLVDFSLFVPFLLFFSFMETLTEPIADKLIGDAPIHKMIVSVVLAAIITPSHRIIENLVRNKLFDPSKEHKEDD